MSKEKAPPPPSNAEKGGTPPPADKPDSQKAPAAPSKPAPPARKVTPQMAAQKKEAPPPEEPKKKRSIKLPKKLKRLNTLFFRISTKDKMLFARHMSIMARSGMHLLESLEILRDRTKTKSFKRVLNNLIEDVRNGQFLSKSLGDYKGAFGDLFISLVRIGEESGTLAENFEYLAEELKKKQELTRKVRGAMIYPAIILIATLGITSLLTFLIFPKILPIFESLSSDLPLATRIFIDSSNFLFAYGGWVVFGLFAFIAALRITIHFRPARFIWHRFLLNIPIMKSMVRAVNIINFSRTLSILLKSGIKIVEALDITADTLSNLVYRKAVKDVAEEVKTGDPISALLVREEHLFPTIFSQMVSIGENTGNLDETMAYLAGYYEEELDEATKAFSTALEPALLLIMGLIVGFVAVAIIGPIYNVTQTLGR